MKTQTGFEYSTSWASLTSKNVWWCRVTASDEFSLLFSSTVKQCKISGFCIEKNLAWRLMLKMLEWMAGRHHQSNICHPEAKSFLPMRLPQKVRPKHNSSYTYGLVKYVCASTVWWLCKLFENAGLHSQKLPWPSDTQNFKGWQRMKAQTMPYETWIMFKSYWHQCLLISLNAILKANLFKIFP